MAGVKCVAPSAAASSVKYISLIAKAMRKEIMQCITNQIGSYVWHSPSNSEKGYVTAASRVNSGQLFHIIINVAQSASAHGTPFNKTLSSSGIICRINIGITEGGIQAFDFVATLLFACGSSVTIAIMRVSCACDVTKYALR